MRIVNVDLNRISGLVLLDANAAFADLVMVGKHLGLDRVLVPGSHADVGVGSFDPQVGLAGHFVSLRPFIGAGRQNGNRADRQNKQAQCS